MKTGLWDYVKAAFSARPIGMFVPPNWIGLAAFGLLGLLNPGFWLLGAGLELAYLYTISGNPRFQRVVRARGIKASGREWSARQKKLIHRLIPPDRTKYRALETRCQSVLEAQQWTGTGAGVELKSQGEGLGRLLWIFLRLLLTRHSIRRMLPKTAPPEGESIEDRLEGLEKRLTNKSLNDNLRKSLLGQSDILKARIEKREEARQKLAFLDAELTRIEEQVELIREQALVTANPEVVSQRIDEISATLGGTTQWISEQKELIGEVEDLLVKPEPVVMPDAPESAEESA